MNDWLTESIAILRVLINDIGTTPTYDDATLQQILFVAARYVVQEVRLNTQYTVDFTGATITPDPSDDADFLNFMILKGACIVGKWKFDELAYVQGIKAKLGPAELSVNPGGMVLINTLSQGPCATYETLKQQFNFGGIGSIRGILSPFVSNTYQPDNDYGRF